MPKMQVAFANVGPWRIVAIAAIAAHGLTDLNDGRFLPCYAIVALLPERHVMAAFLVASWWHFAADWGGSLLLSACLLMGLGLVLAHLGKFAALDYMLIYLVTAHVPEHYGRQIQYARWRGIAAAAAGTVVLVSFTLVGLAKGVLHRCTFTISTAMQRVIVAHVCVEALVAHREGR